jgi:uncharacterized membrane protein YhhN
METAWVWATAAGAGAAVYGFHFLRKPAGLLRTAAKTLAVGALAATAAANQAPVLLCVALALSAIGDLCLAGEGETRFLAGLGAFLLAHAAYAPLFVSLGAGVDPLTAAPWRWIAAIGVLAAAIGLLAWLWPGLGVLRLPVTVYVAVIAVMGVAAWASMAPSGASGLLVAAGATAFMASDAILGAERFRLPAEAPARAWTAHAVWWLYWTGQLAIAFGVFWTLGVI